MKPLTEFLEEAKTKRIKPEVKNRYSDEHAHIKMWNFACLKDAFDEHSLNLQIILAKHDPHHALSFQNAEKAGFSRRRKTTLHEGSYYEELERAAKSVEEIAKHPDFQTAVSEKFEAVMMGTKRGELSEAWKEHGEPRAVSKTDIRIQSRFDPSRGMSISLKKNGDCALMSAGVAEQTATHSIAVLRMLEEEDKYKSYQPHDKVHTHGMILQRVRNVSNYLKEMIGETEVGRQNCKMKAQEELDSINRLWPELSQYMRREAATGEGKFKQGSHQIAQYILKTYSAEKTKGGPAKLIHVDEIDWTKGPPARAALPKGRKGRKSGNVRMDDFYERKRKNG